MSGRIFVLIFFFWAILTIVTPTLILLSENAKSDLDSDVEKSGLKVRRMMGYSDKQTRAENSSATVEAPTPSLAPEPFNGSVEATITTSLKIQ